MSTRTVTASSIASAANTTDISILTSPAAARRWRVVFTDDEITTLKGVLLGVESLLGAKARELLDVLNAYEAQGRHYASAGYSFSGLTPDQTDDLDAAVSGLTTTWANTANWQYTDGTRTVPEAD